MRWRSTLKRGGPSKAFGQFRHQVIGQVHGTRDKGHPNIGQPQKAAFSDVTCWDVPCPMSHVLVQRPNDVIDAGCTSRHLSLRPGRITKHARRIVYLSAPIKTPHPFFQQPNPFREVTAQIERLIEASGLARTPGPAKPPRCPAMPSPLTLTSFKAVTIVDIESHAGILCSRLFKKICGT